MARNIFTITGEFLLKGADKSERDLQALDKTAASTDKKMSGFGKTIGTVGKGLVIGATAIAGAATGLYKMAQSGAEATDRIDKMSQKIGISRQAYQEWDFILSQNGASVDGLQMGMKTLTSAIFEAGKGTQTYTDALQGIGLSYDDLAGLSPEQQFETVFSALQNVEDETTRAALANDLLGRSASELAPALNQGAAAIEEQRKQAHDLGLVLGDEAVNAGVQFTDLIDQLTRTLQGGLLNIMGQLLPIVNQLISTLIEQAPQILAMLQPVFDALIPLLPILIDAILQILNAIIPLLPLIANLIANLLPPLLELIMPFIDMMVQILQEILPPLIPIIQAVAEVLTTVLGAAFEALRPLIDSVIKIFGGLIDFIAGIFTGDWEKAWGGIVKIFSGIWEGIKNIFKAPINFIIGLINGLFERIGSIKIPDWIPGIGGMSVQLPQIPLLAKGTNFFEGGAAIVGEQGAELVTLPRGAKVTPADQTRDMMGSMGNIQINVNGDTSPSGIIRAQRKAQYMARMRLA